MLTILVVFIPKGPLAHGTHTHTHMHTEFQGAVSLENSMIQDVAFFLKGRWKQFAKHHCEVLSSLLWCAPRKFKHGP